MSLYNHTNQRRAVIYCRVSTREQVEEGNSLGTQEKVCRDYCLKNGYEIVEVFVEQGESAKTADRTELQKLLSYCTEKKNSVKAVVIYKLDRLSRNTDDYSQIRLLLKRYSVEIRSTSEHFENTPVGRFMENTIANVAQFDNDIRTERCAGGMKEAVRDGRYVWMAPIGYDNVKVAGKSTIAPNPATFALMQETFQMMASNRYHIDEVRTLMTKKGLTGRKGKPLSKSYFYRLLTNVLYTGWIVSFGERNKGKFEPLVSDELFQQVQRVLKGKSSKHSAHQTDQPDFPLRRFVVNAEGKKLTGSWSQSRTQKKYPYYRFGGLKSNYNRDDFEELFMEFLDGFAFDEAQLDKLREFVKENLVKATMRQRNETERLRKDVEELKARQTGLVCKNLDGVIPDNVLQGQLTLIEHEITKIEAILIETPDTSTDYEDALDFIDDYLRKPSEVWKSASPDVKRKLQWFEFPSGIVFENNLFRTKEISFIFKEKDAFLASDSTVVDPTTEISNQLCKKVIHCGQLVREVGRSLIDLSRIFSEKSISACDRLS